MYPMMDSRSKWTFPAMILALALGSLTGLSLGSLVIGLSLGLVSGLVVLMVFGWLPK